MSSKPVEHKYEIVKNDGTKKIITEIIMPKVVKEFKYTVVKETTTKKERENIFLDSCKPKKITSNKTKYFTAGNSKDKNKNINNSRYITINEDIVRKNIKEDKKINRVHSEGKVNMSQKIIKGKTRNKGVTEKKIFKTTINSKHIFNKNCTCKCHIHEHKCCGCECGCHIDCICKCLGFCICFEEKKKNYL